MVIADATSAMHSRASTARAYRPRRAVALLAAAAAVLLSASAPGASAQAAGFDSFDGSAAAQLAARAEHTAAGSAPRHFVRRAPLDPEAAEQQQARPWIHARVGVRRDASAGADSRRRRDAGYGSPTGSRPSVARRSRGADERAQAHAREHQRQGQGQATFDDLDEDDGDEQRGPGAGGNRSKAPPSKDATTAASGGYASYMPNLTRDKWIGLGLAISSSLAIGTSFIITKKVSGGLTCS